MVGTCGTTTITITITIITTITITTITRITIRIAAVMVGTCGIIRITTITTTRINEWKKEKQDKLLLFPIRLRENEEEKWRMKKPPH